MLRPRGFCIISRPASASFPQPETKLVRGLRYLVAKPFAGLWYELGHIHEPDLRGADLRNVTIRENDTEWDYSVRGYDSVRDVKYGWKNVPAGRSINDCAKEKCAILADFSRKGPDKLRGPLIFGVFDPLKPNRISWRKYVLCRVGCSWC